MVLVDTSVWISHLRDGNRELADLLNKGDVLCHPLIVGGLACGNLKDRPLTVRHPGSPFPDGRSPCLRDSPPDPLR
jgi:predicted nucleic acid-binding protein